MQFVGLDHVTIRIPPSKVEACRAFYQDVIGLMVGPRRLTFPGYWMYANGDTRALVHIAGNMTEEAGPCDTGGVGLDHVAFRYTGLAEAKARLDSVGLAWREVFRPEQGVLQIVVHDPVGTKVEMTFDPAEHPDAPAANG